MVRASLLALAGTAGSTRATAQCLTWDSYFGSTWVGRPYAYLSYDDGHGPALFAGGDIQGGVMKWQGAFWTNVGFLDNAVGALGVYADSDGPALYAGGWFTGKLKKWDGSIWTTVGNTGGGGLSASTVVSLCAYDDGNGEALYVGGVLTGAMNGMVMPVPSKGIIKWDGIRWSSLAGGVAAPPPPWVTPWVLAMAVYDDGSGPALYVGGIFTTAGGIPASCIAKWNGNSWSSVGGGMNSAVNALLVHDDGSGQKLYAGGGFTIAGGSSIMGLARWDGTSWSGLPQGLLGVDSMAVFDDGNGSALVCGGTGGSIGGQPFFQIASWNGTRWSKLGNGLDSAPEVLHVHDDGTGGGPDLYAGSGYGGHITQAGGGMTVFEQAKWLGCGGPIDPICPGDRSFAPCPCSNFGSTGRGCQNSAGTGGALLTSQGLLNPDTLVLTSSGELPSALSIFIQGSALNPTVVPFGDGLLCVGGVLKRLFVKGAANGTVVAPEPGDPSITQQSANLGDPIQPGMVRYYQVYYRDPDPSFCPAPSGSTFNSSNGLRVVWAF